MDALTDTDAGGVEAERFAAFLMADGRAGLITGSQRPTTSALLDEIAAAFEGVVFRVSNPLTAPLNLTRIMVQLDVTDDGGDDALLLRAHLSAWSKLDVPVVLVIDDAHTLDDAALDVVTGLVSAADDDAGVRLLLAGRPDLLGRLGAPGWDILRDTSSVMALALEGAEDAGDVLRAERLFLPAETRPAVPMPPPPLTAPVHDGLSHAGEEGIHPAVSVSPRRLAVSTASQPLAIVENSRPVDVAVPVVVPRRSAGGQHGGPGRGRRWEATGLAAVLAVIVAVGAGFYIPQHRSRTPAGEPVRSTPLASSAEPSNGRAGPDVVPKPPTASTDIVDPGPAPTVPPGPVGLASDGPKAVDPVAPGPSGASDEQLRAEFQAFLVRSGRAALARDPVEFQKLYQGYLRWRSSAQRDAPFSPGR